MSEDRWDAVDRYMAEKLVFADAALDAALEASAIAGLPAHDVSPSQGKLLYLLARMQRARRILEVGTLGGYSTIWLARALPRDGRLLTLEADAQHAEVARSNIVRAALGELVELHVGRAADTLARLVEEGCEPFDLIFIDADKPGSPEYLARSLELSRPGTAIVFDNVVRSGEVIDAASPDPSVQGVRKLIECLATARGVETTVIQTVGSKGHDGFALAIVGDGGE